VNPDQALGTQNNFSTLSISDDPNMQNPWKIRNTGGFRDITRLPRTCYKAAMSQKAFESSYFLMSANGQSRA
jgi:hypothetical protein